MYLLCNAMLFLSASLFLNFKTKQSLSEMSEPWGVNSDRSDYSRAKTLRSESRCEVTQYSGRIINISFLLTDRDNLFRMGPSTRQVSLVGNEYYSAPIFINAPIDREKYVGTYSFTAKVGGWWWLLWLDFLTLIQVVWLYSAFTVFDFIHSIPFHYASFDIIQTWFLLNLTWLQLSLIFFSFVW